MMSKKCGSRHKCRCDRESSRGTKSRSSSSRRKRSLCHRKRSRGRDSSSRKKESSKRTRKSRIERSVELKNVENESGNRRSKNKRREKRQREEINDERRRDKTIKNKTNRRRKRKQCGSSACSRLIELLAKSCVCLKGLDSSSSSSPRCADTSGCRRCCCCCCCRKCRFCTPDCRSKSIQCDDCDSAVVQSRLAILDDAGDRSRSRKNSEPEIEKFCECVVDAKFTATPEKSTKDLGTNFRGTKIKESRKFRDREKKNKSDSGIKSATVANSTVSRDSKKLGNSTESLTDAGPKCPKDCNSRTKPSTPVSSQKLNSKTDKSSAKKCAIKCPCVVEDREKATKAHLIMFDIVFWPHTCFPKRTHLNNKNKKK